MGCRKDKYLTVILAAVVSLVSACDTGTPTSTSGMNSPAVTPAESAGASTHVGTEDAGEELRTVVAESLAYAEVDEQLVHGHFAFPADMVDPLPGVIIIHERWGLDDSTRALAERLAGNGYVVLAVDLFGGETATEISVARNYMVQVVENPELANENIRQAYRFLIESAQAPRVAALGWSFGGNWALNAALLFPDDLAAAVIYYGQVSNNEERLAPMNVPILGLFGEDDRGVPVATAIEFEETLDKLGKDYQIEIYAGARHAFADATGRGYNASAAEDAWSQVLAFFEHYLVETAE